VKVEKCSHPIVERCKMEFYLFIKWSFMLKHSLDSDHEGRNENRTNIFQPQFIEVQY